jgi:hypothetical protein
MVPGNYFLSFKNLLEKKSLTLISRVTSAEPWNSVFISWALFTVYSISCNRGCTPTFSHALGLLFRDGVPFWHGS